MILLVSRSAKVLESVPFIEEAFRLAVVSTSTLEGACQQLKTTKFSLVVLDDGLCDAVPAKLEYLFQYVDSALPVIVSFPTISKDRLLQILKAALDRRQREIWLARENASALFTGELKDELTVLLLSCDVALKDLPGRSAATEKITQVRESALRIAKKLEGHPKKPGAAAAHA